VHFGDEVYVRRAGIRALRRRSARWAVPDGSATREVMGHSTHGRSDDDA